MTLGVGGSETSGPGPHPPGPSYRAPGDPDDPAAGRAARRSAAAQIFVEDLEAPRPDPADLHHLVAVLRLGPAEVVVASDGRGSWRECRLVAGADPAAALVATGPLLHEARPLPAITVAFAPVKGERSEWVVQKLTEVGVDRIVPLRTARSVVRWQAERAERSVARLAKIAREAAAQSRRVWLPELATVCTLGDWAQEESHRTVPVMAEPGGGPVPADLRAVAVGPEGGWSAEELAVGLPTVDLGPQVLRAETAAVVAAALAVALRAGVVSAPSTPGVPAGSSTPVASSTPIGSVGSVGSVGSGAPATRNMGESP